MCLRYEIEKKCACFIESKGFAVEAPCINPVQISCIGETREAVYSNLEKYCARFCPEECDSIEYAISISNAMYPTTSHATRLLNNLPLFRTYYSNMTVSESKESMASLNVFYSTLEYTEIVQNEQFTIIDLISSIGGSMGNLNK